MENGVAEAPVLGEVVREGRVSLLLRSSDLETKGGGSGSRNTVKDNKRVKEAMRAQMRKSEQMRSRVQ